MNICEDTSVLDQRPSILLTTVTTDLSHSWITGDSSGDIRSLSHVY